MSAALWERLTQFDLSVIYCFEPERSEAELYLGSKKIEDTLIYQFAQTQDLIAAYFYVQEQMLPKLKAYRSGVSCLSAKDLVDHFKELHKISSHQLLLHNPQALGCFNQEPSFRWCHGPLMNGEMVAYFSGIHESRSIKEFCDYLSHDPFFIPSAAAEDFLRLLTSIKDDPSYETHPYFSRVLSESQIPYAEGFKALMKLNLAFHSREKLGVKERKIVETLVYPCLPPDTVDFAIMQYANWLLEELLSLKEENLEQMSVFLAEAFYRFTSIHPFMNGNGRIATCLMNLCLRSFDLPSIVIRYPGDDENPESDYAQAFAHIDESRKYLSELILKQILAEQEKTKFDTLELELCHLRLQVLDALQDLAKRHFSLDWLYQRGRLPLLISYEFCQGKNLKYLECLQLQELLLESNKLLKVSSSLTVSPCFFSKHLKSGASGSIPGSKFQELKSFLTELTGISPWKYSRESDGVAWIQVDFMHQAKSILYHLGYFNSELKVDIAKVKEIDNFVVKFRLDEFFLHLGEETARKTI